VKEFWSSVRSTINYLLHRRRLEAEMAEEIRLHLEELTKAHVSAGMELEQAQYAARRNFGGVSQIEERCRDERNLVWLDQLWNDVRFSARSLCHARGFTFTVLITLCLGIGVTTVVLNITEGIILSSSPFPKTGELFYLGNKGRTRPTKNMLIGLQFQAYENQTNVFSEFAGVEWIHSNVVIGDDPIPVIVKHITIDCFHTLGIKPALGRVFLPAEYRDGANDVVIISDLFWREHYNASPDVLGRLIKIDQRLCTVVGVLSVDQMLPPYFNNDLFRPLVLKFDPERPLAGGLAVIGRLKLGVSRQQALAALSSVKFRQLPQWASDYLSEIEPTLTELTEVNQPEIYWVIFAAAVFLYAIACLNAMNLMLIRLLRRRRELTIRFAIGGSRFQVVRLLACESIGLTLAASLIVMLAARWVFPSLFVLITGNGAKLYRDYWDWHTLFCIAALSVIASLAVVLVPATRLLRTEIDSGLKDGGPTLGESRSAGRIRNSLVSIQAAFAVILLTGTGLMLRTFERLHHLDLGFDPIGKVKVQIMVPDSYDLKPEARLQLFERLRLRLSSIPGVKTASFSQDSIFQGYYAGGAQLQMADGTFEPASGNFVSQDYEQTVGLRMKEGRWLSGKKGQIEAVINEAFAKARFGDRDPIGLSFKWKAAGDQPWLVVGVVRDVRETVRSSAGIRFYIPDWMYPGNIDTLVLRLDRDPKKEFAGLVRRAIYEIDPRLIASDVSSIDDIVSESMWAERYAFTILKGLAAIALGLTVVGLFSVVAYTVDSRMTEFGVRIALGAQPSDLHRLVMLRGLAAASVGILIGTAGAVGLTRFMESLLFETKPFDPLVYAGVAILLIASGVAACWLPARRAARVDVTRLLKSE